MKNGDRIEFSFWEAGCLIWVGAHDLCGLPYVEFCQLLWGENPQKLKEFMLEKNVFMAMGLYQDDGYTVRVVMGELNEQEASEWVARVRWKLNLNCGKMVISGILDEDTEEFEAMPSAQEAAADDCLQCYIDVPPGEYQVEVYSYPPGDLSTGWGQIVDRGLFKPTPGIEPESLKSYFERTRTCEELPAWIAYEITEDEQQKRDYYQKIIPYINFVVKLSPVIEDLPTPHLEVEGCLKWEFRKPERCPLGIPVENEALLSKWS